MANNIVLQSHTSACLISPTLGGALLRFTVEGQSILRAVDTHNIANARGAGSFAMIPFSNRIGQASLVWMGTNHPLVRNNGEEPHAIHGVGWQRVWSVLEKKNDYLLLSYEHKADAGWPFDFEASQAFLLKDAELYQTISITNQDTKPTPVGMGWHPYFVKQADTKIKFKASALWQMGEDKLPTLAVPSEGLDTTCEGLRVDHCFEGCVDGVRLEDSSKIIKIESNLNRLVVYTNPTIDCIAVEPVSHVNNAINMSNALSIEAEQLGVKILQPGESVTAQMSIKVKNKTPPL